MENITLELTVQDINNTLALINSAQMSGASAEVVTELKAKFKAALPEVKNDEA